MAVDLSKRQFCLIVSKLLALGGIILVVPAVLAWPNTLGWPLSDWLTRRFPAWQPWECEGINGRGIWAIPELGVDNGLCHIALNGNLVLGRQVNVDSIFIRPPTGSAKIIRL